MRPRRRLRRLAALVLCGGVTVVSAALVLPTSPASADPSATDWYRLRMCESSNNYKINTGNGYYGAYQFDLATWRGVGGAGYPNQASPAEQDARALKLYRLRGWQPWTCAGIVGLREDGDARSGRTGDIVVPAPGGTGKPVAPKPAPKPIPKPKPPATLPTTTVPAWPGPQYYSAGQRSLTIKRFQAQLHRRGWAPIGDGGFGPRTLAEVKRIQGQNGLPQTGILGPVTWKLAWTGAYRPSAPATKAAPKPVAPKPVAAPKPVGVPRATAPAWPGPRYFSYGDRSTTIRRFQNELHARGVFPLGTGDFGPNTLLAVKRLQALNHLPQTGVLGPVTWRLAWTGRVR